MLVSKIWNQTLHGIPTFFLQLSDHEASDDRFVLSHTLNEFVAAECKTIVLTSAKIIQINEMEGIVFIGNLKVMKNCSEGYMEARRLHLLGVKINFIVMQKEILCDVLQIERSTALVSEGILRAVLKKAVDQDLGNSQSDNVSTRKRLSVGGFVHAGKSQEFPSKAAQKQHLSHGCHDVFNDKNLP